MTAAPEISIRVAHIGDEVPFMKGGVQMHLPVEPGEQVRDDVGISVGADGGAGAVPRGALFEANHELCRVRAPIDGDHIGT
jgi:hypothetical protein